MSAASESRTGPAPVEVTVIEPSAGWRAPDLADLWRYRDLTWFLALREIKLRYKQTALGIAWAVLQPLLTMAIFTLFLGRLGGLEGKTGKPYALVTLCALLPWQLFANALGAIGVSVVGNQNLVTKVYFPRLAIPLAAALSGLADFAVTLLLFLLLLFAYGLVPPATALLLPVFVLLALLTALGVGAWLSALNTLYRDVRYALPFLVQCWLFLTPVAYPVSIVPERWRPLYALNPMVGVVEGFRWSLLGDPQPPLGPVLVSSAVSLLILAGGLLYFRRMERSFADLI